MVENSATAFFSFQLGAVSGSHLAGVIENGLGFKPGHIRMRPQIVRNGPCNIDKRLPKIRQCSKIEHLYLRTSNRSSVPSFHFTTWRSCHMLWLHYLYSQLLPRSFFDRLTGLPGFNAGFLVDGADDFWQNTEHLSDYQNYKKPYFHLSIDGDRVDISANPGRRFEYPGMLLSSGWRMWFGNFGLHVLGKEKLLTFPGAERIEELENGTVFIELYRNPEDYDSLENRRRQLGFREWVNMEQLEAGAREKIHQLLSVRDLLST